MQIPALQQPLEENSVSCVGEADQSPGQQARIAGTGRGDGRWGPACTHALLPGVLEPSWVIVGLQTHQLKAGRNQEEVS